MSDKINCFISFSNSVFLQCDSNLNETLNFRFYQLTSVVKKKSQLLSFLATDKPSTRISLFLIYFRCSSAAPEPNCPRRAHYTLSVPKDYLLSLRYTWHFEWLFLILFSNLIFFKIIYVIAVETVWPSPKMRILWLDGEMIAN